MYLVDWIELLRRFGVVVGLLFLVRRAAPALPRPATQLLWAAVWAHLGAAVLATFWDVADQWLKDALGLVPAVRFGMTISTLAEVLYVTGLIAAMYAVVSSVRASVGAPVRVDQPPSYPPRGVPLPPDMFRTHVRPPDATHLAPAPYQRDPDLTTMLPPPGTTQINPQPPYPPPPAYGAVSSGQPPLAYRPPAATQSPAYGPPSAPPPAYGPPPAAQPPAYGSPPPPPWQGPQP